MSKRIQAVLVVDEDGTPRSNLVNMRLFASEKNARKKIRDEHGHHDRIRAIWLRPDNRLGKPHDIGEWKKPRMYLVEHTTEGGLRVIEELAL